MRTIRECVHCGKEFYCIRDAFCSFECADEVSS